MSEESRYSLLGASWRDTEGVALQIADAAWSYAEIAEGGERWAGWLRRQGFRAGEVMLCPTTPALESVLMQQAVTLLGGALFPVSDALPAARREALIRTTGAEWVWAPADQTSNRTSNQQTDQQTDQQSGQRPQQQGMARRGTTGSLRRIDAPPRSQPTATDERSPAVLVETSGSSADPKVAMLSAANVVASCTRVIERLALGAGDRWLCVLPRYHVGGLAIGYRCAMAGATLCIEERFDPQALHRSLHERAITHVSLVPAMLQRMLDEGLAPPAQLRVALLGGQRLDPGLARRGVEAGWPLYLGYGMTETFSQIAGAWIDSGGSAAGGLKPLAGVQFDAPLCAEAATMRTHGGAPQRRADDTTFASSSDRSQTQAPPSAAAEGAENPAETIAPLQIRAPMLMLGYANPARAPGLGLERGWLKSGDLACRTTDGGLTILGRADDLIIVAGINLRVADVEDRFSALDGIGEVAVVGLPDAAWGHRLVMLYTGELEPAAIEQWARAALPSHQRPRGFLRLREFPTLASGKRDRRALERQAAAAFETGPRG